MLEDSGVLFSVATPEVLERCNGHAMDVTIVEKGSATKRASVMFPAQYLPRLINFMEQATVASGSWATRHALFISMKNMYDLDKARIQGDLLELFRLLSNIGKVEIDGEELLEGYAEGLQNSMMAARFEHEEWLETVTEMTNRGEKSLEKQEYHNAAQQGQAAIISMTYAYLTRPEVLHSQAEAFAKAIQRLRWRTELLIAKAISAKYPSTTTATSWPSPTSNPSTPQKQTAVELLAAEAAASHALSLATDSPSPASNPWVRSLPAELIPPNKGDWFTDSERGTTWHLLGLVHIALGEFLFAAGDLERAAGLLGNSGSEEMRAKVEDAFARAREGIDWEIRPGVGLKKAAWVARRDVD